MDLYKLQVGKQRINGLVLLLKKKTSLLGIKETWFDLLKDLGSSKKKYLKFPFTVTIK